MPSPTASARLAATLSYEALAADPEIDIVYVATPHPMHHTAAKLCLNAGKAVLCEKPFTVNATEAEEVIALARERKLFLMEAMWTRYLPLMVRFRELIAAGAIGEPRLLTADFGFRADGEPSHRLFNPDLAGGALLDVGVYVVSLASMIFGPPERGTGMADIGATGVDEQAALVFGYPGGKLAQLTVAVRTNTPQEVTLMGTEGTIRIPPIWWRPTTAHHHPARSAGRADRRALRGQRLQLRSRRGDALPPRRRTRKPRHAPGRNTLDHPHPRPGPRPVRPQVPDGVNESAGSKCESSKRREP